MRNSPPGAGTAPQPGHFTDRPAPTGPGRKLRRVLLLVETSTGSGRDILRGIARYVRQRLDWVLFHEPCDVAVAPPGWVSEWKGDGVIVRVRSRALAEAVRATGLPAVDVLGLVPEAGFPQVQVDEDDIAWRAAHHLRQRGFRYVGFYGLSTENWSIRRREAFRRATRYWSATFSVYERPRPNAEAAPGTEPEPGLLRWLQSLPKPAGVMLCSDELGLEFLAACRQAGYSVPDEIAVIGVDNDEGLCEIARPPLSTVWPAYQRVGYSAAALLDKLRKGQPPPCSPIVVSSTHVVRRRSTDALAVREPTGANALQVIRQRACRGLSVDEVAEATGVSRSVLQRRFQAELGCTVLGAILDVRIQRACDLLRETNLPISTVAVLAGFKHQAYLGAVLKKHLGKTPAHIRREAEPWTSSWPPPL